MSVARAGISAPIRLEEMRQHMLAMLDTEKDDVLPESFQQTPDISTHDLYAPSPDEVVDNAITKEMKRLRVVWQGVERALERVRKKSRKRTRRTEVVSDEEEEELDYSKLDLTSAGKGRPSSVHVMRTRHHQGIHEEEEEEGNGENGGETTTAQQQRQEKQMLTENSGTLVPGEGIPGSQTGGDRDEDYVEGREDEIDFDEDTGEMYSEKEALKLMAKDVRERVLYVNKTRPLSAEVIGAVQERIPCFEDLVDPVETQLETVIQARRRQVKQAKRKEVNYITSVSSMPSGISEPVDDVGHTAVDNTELVLSVSLFHAQASMKVQEFLVLGSQYLSELKDKFYCLSDQMLDGSKHIMNSYFFIEGVFYNDRRNPTSIDYSKNIIEWAQTNPNFKGPRLTSKPMHQTRFCDLEIRVGQPYLYLHQGNCEHAFVFTDVRLINSDDPKDRSRYPLHVFQCRMRRRKCHVCDIYPARYVCYGDKLSQENPAFYCDHCYRPLHYSRDGKLLYQNYEVFPYFHE